LWWVNLNERDHLEDAGAGGGIISNESGGNRIESWGPDSSGLEQRPVVGSSE